MEIRKPPVSARGPYRSYDTDDLTRAFLAVKNKELSIRKASVTYGVPFATLADRIAGRISVDTVKSGVFPLFSQEQESLLAQHLNTMAEVGYGYTRQETMNLATDYAIELGLRTKDDRPVSDKWLYNFLGRWPELKLKKPRALEIARAKSATRDAVDNYFTELKRILVKYDLEDKPNRIFNVDEKVNTEHKPPKVVAGKFNKTQAVTSGKSKTTTVIGKYMRESGGRLITRYDVCQLACKVYSSTLTVPNIVAAFKRCGIHPFNSAVVSDSVVAPATTFKSQNPPPTESSGNSNVPKSAENFLLRKGGKILENVQSAKKERKTLSKVIGGNLSQKKK
ncbi:uncharacterized protein LOC128549658 [Mercenaria mercenaria]|uniref:uncharacterized protein LOC128549658 n=1 Tax=Mercenaria mercenaria TaxID=6596 RepID=UPI00234EC3E7|nr:uncharacterized protein LOC128549658 [Mercenaria mercenaria]